MPSAQKMQPIGDAFATQNLTKQFGNVTALKAFTHQFEQAKIHALVGKNGSGKSTLVKMLAGTIRPTQGSLYIDGKEVEFSSPAAALKAGVCTVHQELSLVQDLSVTENIFLGHLPKFPLLGLCRIDWAQARKKTTQLLQQMQIDIDANAIVKKLSVGQQQTIEIAKAMHKAPKLLLLDEPTSALAGKEVAMLFGLLRNLRQQGTTMLYISHRLSELSEIADSVTVLRDGNHVASAPMATTTNQDIVTMMFGDTHEDQIRGEKPRPAPNASQNIKPILQIKNLTRQPAFTNINFSLKPGEVLGIAGMLGAGRTELLRAIFGADPFDRGEIYLRGQAITDPSPQKMSAMGLGYTPENRKEVGLVQAHSIHANLSMASLRQNAPHGLIKSGLENQKVQKQIADLAIKIHHTKDPVHSLSGGNQQKVVIGNWLNTHPQIMFYDEPSRGVDVQAKQQIFQIIRTQAQKGVAALFVSTELEEILTICDRILVMKNGSLQGELDPDTTTLTQLYTACMEGM